MSRNIDIALIIATAALAAAVCRLGGFWFMRFVPMTPRLEAGLKSLPLGVMIGLMVPAVLRGGIPEAGAIAATIIATRAKLNDFIALACGIGTVAALRIWF